MHYYILKKHVCEMFSTKSMLIAYYFALILMLLLLITLSEVFIDIAF